MQIILMSTRGKTPRTLTISKRHIFAATLSLLAVTVALTAGLAWSVLTQRIEIPGLAVVGTGGEGKQDKFLRDNLNAMAAKIGEMQAQMVRLDALGERVSGLAGVKPQEFNFKQPPGRGGVDAGKNARDMSLPELKAEIEQLSKGVELRSDVMSVLESALLDKQIRGKSIPTVQPVEIGYDSSSFGWRYDPFSGRRSMHEGIDFVAPVGTDIKAAAGGMVAASEWHHQYGNMVDVDHGNGLKTRYAHASKVLVKVGDLVKAGQKIAEVGSTGRSTGAHLHFEVHVNGVTQDPNKFLQSGGALAENAKTVSAAR